jgi:biopolymer transport protein ExbB
MKGTSLFERIVEISVLSGGLIPLMVFVFVVALALCIERWWFFRANLKAGEAMEHDLKLVEPGDEAKLEQVARHYAGSLQAVVVVTGLASRGADLATADRRIEEAILWQLPKLDRNVWWIDTTVTLGPLMGLFGTIIGMIESFSVLGQAGTGNPDAVTGGVAHALVATALGLFIAMVCLVFLNYFNKRNRLAVHQFDLLKQMVLNRLFDGRMFDGLGAPRSGGVTGIDPAVARMARGGAPGPVADSP